MARYRVFFGGSTIPAWDGDDAVDPYAIRVEDPVGTVVSFMTPAGANFAQSARVSATYTIPTNTFGLTPALVRARYSFASQGGAQGTIGLTGAPGIPSGSTILGGYLSVVTIPVGGGASIAVQVEAANDTIAAAAISGAPWSTTGHKAIIPVFTVATELITTAARDVSIVISGANLTAGVFDVVLLYVPGA